MSRWTSLAVDLAAFQGSNWYASRYRLRYVVSRESVDKLLLTMEIIYREEPGATGIPNSTVSDRILPNEQQVDKETTVPQDMHTLQGSQRLAGMYIASESSYCYCRAA